MSDYYIPRERAIDALNKVRDLVWEVDIPSPTVPEYIEHHEQMKSIMRNIDIITNDIIQMPTAQPEDWMEQNKDRILKAGMEGREVEFMIGGRLFAIREKAQ